MTANAPFTPALCVVGFHHARGPEIESWYGVPSGSDPAVDNDWSFFPFMALSDGAHASAEDFSYFTLRQKATASSAASSLFGMSCTRQLDARELLKKPADVTRSTVQKSLVIIAQSPHIFAGWREKLSVVTMAWFSQRDFSDTEILKHFQESLVDSEREAEGSYLGISLREFIHEYRHQVLVLLKCCLLQPKMLFFGSRCERLCMVQFALISLIPGLLRRLEDCADPELNSYESGMVMPTSLRSSDRRSLLAYMGLPLQIFGKGSLFGPYTPLQQLDLLADVGTKSYMFGSTNSLLLQQKDRYSDILINLDDSTITITSPSLRSALSLSAADRRWIDSIHQAITSSWDPSDPSRPLHHGYLGSEEFIRYQFEEYLLALVSATKCQQYLQNVPNDKRGPTTHPEVEGDPTLDFSEAWMDAWKTTENYRLWDRITDTHLFDVVEPKHPTAGGLSVEDINRRFIQQIQDLHLDERLATSREVLGKHLAVGQKKVSTTIYNLWAEIEARREALASQRQQGRLTPPAVHDSTPITEPSSTKSETEQLPATAGSRLSASVLRVRPSDTSGAQAAMGTVGTKAGTYLSSWGAWANERRKGWGRSSSGYDVSESLAGPSAKTKSEPIAMADDESGQKGKTEPETADGAEKGREKGRVAGRESQQSFEMFWDANKASSSPLSPKSARKGKRFSRGREKVIDGIGRLDA